MRWLWLAVGVSAGLVGVGGMHKSKFRACLTGLTLVCIFLVGKDYFEQA